MLSCFGNVRFADAMPLVLSIRYFTRNMRLRTDAYDEVNPRTTNRSNESSGVLGAAGLVNDKGPDFGPSPRTASRSARVNVCGPEAVKPDEIDGLTYVQRTPPVITAHVGAMPVIGVVLTYSTGSHACTCAGVTPVAR